MTFDIRIHRGVPRILLAVVAGALLLAPLAFGGCDAGGIASYTGGAGGAACGTGILLCAASCVDAKTDPVNCGACGVVCSTGEVCSAGHCNLSCVGGATKCAALCVDVANDPANCGACAATCANGEVCSGSKCGLACVGGATKCGALCVDVASDPANCGVCAVACTNGEVCSAGQCGLTCVGGATKCGALCVDTSVDPGNCGVCGTACANGEVCSAGQCGLTCVGGATKCGALCVDTNVDPGNCGVCGTACVVGEVCSAGTCGVVCLGGTTLCGALCKDVQKDPANCGVCGTACAVGEVCSAGTCGVVCLGGTTLCGALCKDLQKDPANCGVCGTACAITEQCSAGACTAAPTVISTNPVNTAHGVAIDQAVEATFSVAMNPLTIDGTTFTLAEGGAPIAGAVTYAGTTATFKPTVNYPLGAFLTATITTGAKDTNGNALLKDYVWTFQTGSQAGQGTVELGLAGPFAILAFNTVTNVNNVGTIVTGDLGISPGASLVGFPPGVVIGSIHLGDPVAAAAKAAVLAAYNDAVGRLGAAVLPGDLSGLTFAPGVYKNSTSVLLSAGNLTLDASGDSNAVFIFQMGSTLTTSSGTQVILSGGAKATNVFWAVGTSATLGTTSAFKGTVIAGSAITMKTGASIEGRLLAQGAAVALDTNLITVPLP